MARDKRRFGPLPREWAHYKGLYQFKDHVIISYTVGTAKILETFGLGMLDSLPVFTRTLNISPTDKPLKMRVAPSGTAVALTGEGAVLKEQNGFIVLETSLSKSVKIKLLIGKSGMKGLQQYAKTSSPPEALESLITGGPARYPQKLTTEVMQGTQEGQFQVDIMNPPFNSPWKNQFRLSGLDFFRDTNVEIYHENVRRLSAHSFYYFSHDYFRDLINATDFNSVLFVAEKDDEIIAGAIMTICNGIIQYHLGGTKNEMLKFSPLKLVIDGARIYANEMGCNYCHLGGGYSGVDDSLFRFKAGFSKDFCEFKVWRKIVNIQAYNELVTKKFGDKIPSSDYFPLYRWESKD